MLLFFFHLSGTCINGCNEECHFTCVNSGACFNYGGCGGGCRAYSTCSECNTICTVWSCGQSCSGECFNAGGCKMYCGAGINQI